MEDKLNKRLFNGTVNWFDLTVNRFYFVLNKIIFIIFTFENAELK